MAWVEMARGLLVHWLQVDADGRVAACRVLAPTEWNFHPQGAVAAALENMPAQACAAQVAQVNTLVAAYDPCVRFEIQTKARAAENVRHA
jgi:coenzyme F420-reducing hydrogenase alpha subunit